MISLYVLSSRSLLAPVFLACVFAIGACFVVSVPALAEHRSDPVTYGISAPSGARVRPVPGALIRAFDPPEVKWGTGHRGVDLNASVGEPVGAVMAGQVSFSGVVADVGWVTVDHGGGLKTTYGPLVDRVAVGVRVGAGQRLGRVAAHQAVGSDVATPVRHLDWGAKLNGTYIDPRVLLYEWQPCLTAPLLPHPARRD